MAETIATDPLMTLKLLAHVAALRHRRGGLPLEDAAAQDGGVEIDGAIDQLATRPVVKSPSTSSHVKSPPRQL
jgi:hypothetical protein